MNTVLTSVAGILIIAGSISVAFGSHLPIIVKWFSFGCMTLAGVIFGFYLAGDLPFSQKILATVFWVVLLNGSNIYFRWLRRGKPW